VTFELIVCALTLASPHDVVSPKQENVLHIFSLHTAAGKGGTPFFLNYNFNYKSLEFLIIINGVFVVCMLSE